MKRAWPFEDRDENAPIKDPDDFVRRLGKEGTEAIVIRIGANDAQVVLVDANGRWERWVYHSIEEATEVAEGLRVPVHVGEYPEETRVRINRYSPPEGHFETSAYPEQGRVGPVKLYPENRPRQLDDASKEKNEEAPS